MMDKIMMIMTFLKSHPVEVILGSIIMIENALPEMSNVEANSTFQAIRNGSNATFKYLFKKDPPKAQ